MLLPCELFGKKTTPTVMEKCLSVQVSLRLPALFARRRNDRQTQQTTHITQLAVTNDMRYHVGSDTDTAAKRFLRCRVNRWIQTPDNRLNFRVEKLAANQHQAISGVETRARHFHADWQRFRSLRGRLGCRTVPSLGPGQSVDFSER